MLQGDEQEQQLLQAGSELLRREQQRRQQQQRADQQVEMHEGQQMRSGGSVAAGWAGGSYDNESTASAGGSKGDPYPYGTYLGLTYQKQGGGSLPASKATNNFVLLGPNGSTVWHYVKAYPVPMVEAGVVPGGWVGGGAGGGAGRNASGSLEEGTVGEVRWSRRSPPSGSTLVLWCLWVVDGGRGRR